MTAPDTIVAHRASCPALCRQIRRGTFGVECDNPSCSAHCDHPNPSGHHCACTVAAKLRELVNEAWAIVEANPNYFRLRVLLAPFREKER